MNLWENRQDLEEKLFFDLQMTTENTTKISEILRENEKEEGLNQQWKEFENDLGEGMWLMESILTSHFEKNLRITPGKLEESGKILGKDLWVWAH